MTQVELLNMTFKWFLLIRTKSTFQSVVLYLIKNAECIKFYLKWKYNDSNRSVECIKNATWHLFYLEKKAFRISCASGFCDFEKQSLLVYVRRSLHQHVCTKFCPKSICSLIVDLSFASFLSLCLYHLETYSIESTKYVANFYDFMNSHKWQQILALSEHINQKVL